MKMKEKWALEYSHKVYPDSWASQVFTKDAMDAGIPVRFHAQTCWLDGFEFARKNISELVNGITKNSHLDALPDEILKFGELEELK